MHAYRPPTQDMSFLLREVFQAAPLLAECPAYAEFNADLYDAVLTEAGRFCAQELAPINRIGDETGCRCDAGVVTTPPGVREAWAAFVEGGWPSLSLPPEFGGQGLPKTMQFLVDEMIAGANLAFSLYPGLTRGAAEALHAHGAPELKAAWLPNMVSGVWTGAMSLTEAQAGTDLGLVRVKAEPTGDGAYRLSGEKIFISAGEHDLADNIVHLVLARLPDAPAGVRGLSLFLTPKYTLDGARNAMTAGAIEHKMGIKASPTCVMHYDGALGWLVGEPHQGLAAMFTMMNSERLFVGVQGIGVAAAAAQYAAAYALDRVQGRHPRNGGAAVLADHADVRRNLLTARAHVEGMRALALWTALQLDRSEAHPDPAARAAAEQLVALLTPIIKASGSDLGLEAAVAAQQVFGGHGYIREWGLEQLVRDVRITQIYEGANGVQAMDLVGRKLTQDDGAAPRAFFALIEGYVAEAQAADLDPALRPFLSTLAELLADARRGVELVALHAAAEPQAPGAVAVDLLKLLTLLALGWMWARQVQAALARPADDPLRQAKLAVGGFFLARIAPQRETLLRLIAAGGEAVVALPEGLFAPH